MAKYGTGADKPVIRSLRCAIYTRKSSEEGLEQDFNSLDAQREACEAYIRSQKHEGWQCLSQSYDDRGISGGTLERPRLQQLLAHIKAGQVDVVVVYKVDRLTRSLADFAKLVEVFDAKGVSFVSVTQQFNTTTAMGRLTLNVLLSFAQFEREVTGERIRDKIAASKQKGMWMGGNPPLGYDVKDRSLVVNPSEAETVRQIFLRYAALGSVRALKTQLDAEGTISKVRKFPCGRQVGGKPITRGALYRLLQNRIYLGETVHREHSYPGKHAAIVDAELWSLVQKKLSENRIEHVFGSRAKHPSLLTGLLFDAAGHRLTPTHAVKSGNRRYRYYVSQPLTIASKEADRPGVRLPAAELEKVVRSLLQTFLLNPTAVHDSIRQTVPTVSAQKALLAAAKQLSGQLPSLPGPRIKRLLHALLHRIDVHPDHVDLHLSPVRLTQVLRGEIPDGSPKDDPRETHLTLTAPVQLCITGNGIRMLVDGSSRSKDKPDPSLVRLIITAHALKDKLLGGAAKTIEGLAKLEGVSSSWCTRVLRLAFLAPDITEALLEGSHPPTLTAIRLLKDSRLPYSWKDQRQLLGFTAIKS